MSNTTTKSSNKKSWSDAFKAYTDKRALIMLFLGFSAGIPILLIFSSLSLWLREAGIDKSTVTMFSWAALGYSFKFVWAPLVDALPLPVLTNKLGRRRAWLLVAQVMIAISICLMALINPTDPDALTVMAFGAVLLGFSSATQDIVIDAYRIELAPPNMQSILSATYNAGYRIGMIVAGAGALYLATYFGSTKDNYNYDAWRMTYFCMAATMLVGMITTLLIHEPAKNAPQEKRPIVDYLRLVAVFFVAVIAFVFAFKTVGGLLPKADDALVKFSLESLKIFTSIGAAVLTGYIMVVMGLVDKSVAHKTWVEPIQDFFNRYGKKAFLLLALIGLYRISDIVAGVISNVFYQDMNFTKNEIATAVKTFGVVMTIVGGFAGGIIAQRFNVMKAMMLGAILASSTNLLFVLLAQKGHDVFYLYLAVTVDNLASGLAGAVFIAFLSALTSIRFTAVQYAIFSSLMTLLPKVLGGYSGTIVDSFGYESFFIFCAIIGLPILILVYLVDKHIPLGENDKT